MCGSLFCPRPRPRFTFRPPHSPPASPPPPHPLIVRPPPRRRLFRRRLLRSGAAAAPRFSCEYSFARRRAVFAAPRRAFSILRSFLLIGLNSFSKNLLRVPKSHFWQSAPDLPHTCGFCGKSEFAAFIKSVPFHMPKREKTGRRSDIVAKRRVFSQNHGKKF